MLYLDAVIWFLHVILLSISYEESVCLFDPDHVNMLNIAPEERNAAAHIMASCTGERGHVPDNDAEPLLPSTNTTKSCYSVLPPISEPVLVVRWGELWRRHDTNDDNVSTPPL